MPYSTYNDILTELGEKELIRITNSDGTAPNQSKAESAIGFADLMIDAYIAGRYVLPLSGASPGILSKISKDLAINFLYEGAYAKTSMPNTIVWKKIDAVKLLKLVQMGDIILPNQFSTPPFIITNTKCSDY